MLFILAAAAMLGAGLAPTPALAAREQACGQRVKVNIHYRPTKYNYSETLGQLQRIAGKPVWGYYQSASQVSGEWSRKGKCVYVRIAVIVNSVIYVANELQRRKNPRKYKCHFGRILNHEKKHRDDDRRSLRNMLKKRNALLNKVNRGQVKNLEKFIDYTVNKVQDMLNKYYREAGKRSDYFHKNVESSC